MSPNVSTPQVCVEVLGSVSFVSDDLGPSVEVDSVFPLDPSIEVDSFSDVFRVPPLRLIPMF